MCARQSLQDFTIDAKTYFEGAVADIDAKTRCLVRALRRELSALRMLWYFGTAMSGAVSITQMECDKTTF